MAAANPADRVLIARIAAHERWAGASQAQRTATGRRGQSGLEARWRREIDPDGTMPPAELAARVASARKAHMHRLALRSAQSRRKAS